MYSNKSIEFPKLAYSIEDLSLASAIGRTSIYYAIKAGELVAFNPVVNGRKIKRTLILPEEAQKWIDKLSKTS